MRKGECSSAGEGNSGSRTVVGSRTPRLAFSENMGFLRIASEGNKLRSEFIHESTTFAFRRSRSLYAPLLNPVEPNSYRGNPPPIGTQNLERNVPFGGCAVTYRLFSCTLCTQSYFWVSEILLLVDAIAAPISQSSNTGCQFRERR